MTEDLRQKASKSCLVGGGVCFVELSVGKSSATGVSSVKKVLLKYVHKYKWLRPMAPQDFLVLNEHLKVSCVPCEVCT